MEKDFLETWYGLALIVIFTFVSFWLVLIGMASPINYFSNKYECEDQATKMGVNYNYGYWQNCMIEVEPNKWIPKENYVYGDKEK